MANVNSQFKSGGILRPWDIDVRTGIPRPGVLIRELGVEVQAGPQSVAIGKHIIIPDKSVAIGEELQPGPGYGGGRSVIVGFNNTHAGGNTVQVGTGISAGGGNSVYVGTDITAPSVTNNILIGTTITSLYPNCIAIGTLSNPSRDGEVVMGGIGTNYFRLAFQLPTFADNTAAAALALGSFYKTSTGAVMQRIP